MMYHEGRFFYDRTIASFYVAARAIKCCSSVPELRQEASHGCAEEPIFRIGYENMFGIVHKSTIRGKGIYVGWNRE
jgi:hypothetical protein